MSDFTDKLIDEINQALGSNERFVQPSDLVRAGLFGSQTAVLGALNKGIIPHFRISTNRRLIPRDAVLEYVRSCYRSTAHPG